MSGVDEDGPGEWRAVRRFTGLVVVCSVAGIAAGPGAGCVAGAVLVVVLLAVARRRRKRAGLVRAEDVATMFEVAARSVRAGANPLDALGEAAALCGGSLDRLDPVTGAVVGAVLDMVRGPTGGGARGLEAGAMLLREQIRTRDEITGAAAQSRASSGLLVAVPLLFTAVSLALSPMTVSGIVTRPLVAGAVVAGIGLQLIALAWSRSLVRASWGRR